MEVVGVVEEVAGVGVPWVVVAWECQIAVEKSMIMNQKTFPYWKHLLGIYYEPGAGIQSQTTNTYCIQENTLQQHQEKMLTLGHPSTKTIDSLPPKYHEHTFYIQFQEI